MRHMSTEVYSTDEIAQGTRVRTLTARNSRNPETGKYDIPVPAGTEGIIDSCTHAGFQGRIHWIRLDNGTRSGSYTANEVEILSRPANPRYTTGAPARCQI